MRLGSALVAVCDVMDGSGGVCAWARGLLSDREWACARQRCDTGLYVAGRVAAKRAVLEALGVDAGAASACDEGRLEPDARNAGDRGGREVEVLADDEGAPRVTLGDGLRPLLGPAPLPEVLVSITNENGLALALAVTDEA